MPGRLTHKYGEPRLATCLGCGHDFLSPPSKKRGYLFYSQTCGACIYRKRVRRERVTRTRKKMLAYRAKFARDKRAAGVIYKAGKWYGDSEVYWYYTKLRRAGMERDEARAAAVALFNKKRAELPQALTYRIERAGGMVERVKMSGDPGAVLERLRRQNLGAEIFVESNARG